MIYYLLIVLATVMLAVNFGLVKLYQSRAGVSNSAVFLFIGVPGILEAIIFFVINKFTFEFTPFSAIMAILMALAVFMCTVTGFHILKNGKIALYTLFLMTGGMVVPYIWGLAFLGEQFSLLRAAGLFLIIFAVVISNTGSEKPTLKQILLCIALFMFNGCTSVISKTHQIEVARPIVSTTSFVILVGIAKFIFCTCGFLFSTSKGTTSIKELFPWKKIFLIFPASAIFDGSAYMLQLIGATHLPATVLYPFITGLTIVFTAVMGMVCYHEKPSLRVWIGIVMCLMGTCLFL